MRRIIVFAGGGGSEIFYFDEGGISLGEGVILSGVGFHVILK